MYIRKNHLTINENPEIFEIVSDDGRTVRFSGPQKSISNCLGTSEWECGDTVIEDSAGTFLLATEIEQ